MKSVTEGGYSITPLNSAISGDLEWCSKSFRLLRTTNRKSRQPAYVF